jgi:lipopolysaccharide export system protein LptA
MANSFHKNPSCIFLMIIAMLMPSAWAQVPDIALQKTLPINLDADSSEFDRKNNVLFFHGLRITQGVFSIEADEATAAKLDFENSRWTFIGNVVIESEDAKAYSDRAEVLFQEHHITNAIMQGIPVRFAQASSETGKTTEGHANKMEYDLASGVIRLSEDAWLSDGANEVSGSRISYDLIREYIIADSDENGQVRMKIIPPQNGGTESTP